MASRFRGVWICAEVPGRAVVARRAGQESAGPLKAVPDVSHRCGRLAQRLSHSILSQELQGPSPGFPRLELPVNVHLGRQQKPQVWSLPPMSETWIVPRSRSASGMAPTVRGIWGSEPADGSCLFLSFKLKIVTLRVFCSQLILLSPKGKGSQGPLNLRTLLHKRLSFGLMPLAGSR